MKIVLVFFLLKLTIEIAIPLDNEFIEYGKCVNLLNENKEYISSDRNVEYINVEKQFDFISQGQDNEEGNMNYVKFSDKVNPMSIIFKEKNGKDSKFQYLIKIGKNTDYIKDKENSGLFLWFTERTSKINNEIESPNLLVNTTNLNGMGLKISEYSLFGVINNGEKLSTPLFTGGSINSNKFECDFTEKNEILIKITYLNNNIIIETYNKDNWSLCYIKHHVIPNESIFLIQASLKDEKMEYIISSILKCDIKGFTRDELDNTNNNDNDNSDKNNKILDTKVQIIQDLIKEVNNSTEYFSQSYDKIFKYDNFENDLNAFTKYKFDADVISQVLDQKLSFLDTKTSLQELDNQIGNNSVANIKDIINDIKNITLDRYEYKAAEKIVNSLDYLKTLQSKFDSFMLDIEKNTRSSFGELKLKAEKVEVYNLMEMVLFCLIIILSLILYFIFRSVQEKDKLAMNSSSNSSEIRMAA